MIFLVLFVPADQPDATDKKIGRANVETGAVARRSRLPVGIGAKPGAFVFSVSLPMTRYLRGSFRIAAANRWEVRKNRFWSSRFRHFRAHN